MKIRRTLVFGQVKRAEGAVDTLWNVRQRDIEAPINAEKISEDVMFLQPSTYAERVCGEQIDGGGEGEGGSGGQPKVEQMKVARATWTFDSEGPGSPKVWVSAYLDVTAEQAGGGERGNEREWAAEREGMQSVNQTTLQWKGSRGAKECTSALVAAEHSRGGVGGGGKKSEIQKEVRENKFEKPVRKPPPVPPAAGALELEIIYLQALQSALWANCK